MSDVFGVDLARVALRAGRQGSGEEKRLQPYEAAEAHGACHSRAD
ncbi:hypothetical protein AB0N06_36535 [Streptomyces sp. NPDC051020]